MKPPNNKPLSSEYAIWVANEVNAFWRARGYYAEARVEIMPGGDGSPYGYVVRSNMLNGIPTKKIPAKKIPAKKRIAA